MSNPFLKLKLAVVVVGFFIFNHKISPSSTQKTAGLKIRKQNETATELLLSDTSLLPCSQNSTMLRFSKFNNAERSSTLLQQSSCWDVNVARHGKA